MKFRFIDTEKGEVVKELEFVNEMEAIKTATLNGLVAQKIE